VNESHTPSERRTDAERTRTDASAGWREECAAQHVDHAITTDGGERPERAPLSAFADGGTTETLPTPGDRVRDDDADDAREVIVVETHPDTNADEWFIEELGATVAGVNPVFDPNSPVVEAVYAEDISETLDGWRSVEDLRDAVSFGALQSYTFPADRLSTLPGGERR